MTKSKTIPEHNPNPTPEETKEAHAIAMAIVLTVREAVQALRDSQATNACPAGETEQLV